MRYLASQTRPIAYLPIPKAGLTSTLNNLHWLDTGRFFDDPLAIHGVSGTVLISQSSDPAGLERRLAEGKVLAVVRDPLRRAFSLFNEKAYHIHRHSFPKLRRRLIADGASLAPGDDLATHREDFRLFLLFVQGQVRRAGPLATAMNPHWRPLRHFFRAAVRRHRMPDFIARTERLSDDFEAFLAWVGVPEAPPRARFNEGPSAIHPYEAVVDDDAIQALARDVYGADCRLFGYPEPGR